jgi:uncharacterized protein (DUF305 family)
MSARNVAFTTVVAALLIGALWSAAVGPQPVMAQHDQHAARAANTRAQSDEFARALAAAMDKMHQDMMTPSPTGNADVDFLATMIPHHAGAVEMARLVLIHGKDPLVRQLAEEIIAGQQAEIAAMQARLNILRQGSDPNPGGYPALGGTRGAVR